MRPDANMNVAARSYTSALGLRFLTPLDDFAIAVFTRQGHWRSLLVQQVAPKPGDQIVDVGCGTGTLSRALKQAAPDATVISIDPDPEMLSRARATGQEAGLDIPYFEGFFDDVFASQHRPLTKVVPSLVLHQVPMTGKSEILRTAHGALCAGGEIHIADYRLQRTRLMRSVFRNTVQRIDGRKDTDPNARGVLPALMREAGFAEVVETYVIPTPTGLISIYRALATNENGPTGHSIERSIR